MNPAKREELKRLLDAATPGPWAWHPDAGFNYDDEHKFCTLTRADDVDTVVASSCDGCANIADEPDAALIAAAPAALRELLADCEALEERMNAPLGAVINDAAQMIHEAEARGLEEAAQLLETSASRYGHPDEHRYQAQSIRALAAEKRSRP